MDIVFLLEPGIHAVPEGGAGPDAGQQPRPDAVRRGGEGVCGARPGDRPAGLQGEAARGQEEARGVPQLPPVPESVGEW